ncbi:hypothetical protein BY996DRAFT_6700518 [Phakopsora pachyrhizi]|uniref:Expressed protein n=1 Tax=Phakopsora pachyrhizi TaxID=170000 RepID=A0AAV0BJ97_PHAPC|nr:hypothetical protein BY996DRAFT_6700518 [Phakopsora pachyrhizi]CAH7686640.1 expressed protein [Phakopsora pachyrhizi]
MSTSSTDLKSNNSNSSSSYFDENTNEVFIRGLKDIIKTYETQLNRPLSSQELLTIRTQAKEFFLKQNFNNTHDNFQPPSQPTNDTQNSSQSDSFKLCSSPVVVPSFPTKLSTSSTDSKLKPKPITNDDTSSSLEFQVRRDEDDERVVVGVDKVEEVVVENLSYPTSFNEIAQLIASGKPLDQNPLLLTGLRDIPDRLNSIKPSEAIIALDPLANKKPWQ